MKTIKQIADEIGVTKQAVHKKIKQPPLSTSLQGLTSTVNGTLHFAVDGEKLIKAAFDKGKPSTMSTKLVDDVSSIAAQLIASLQGQVNTLTEQNKDLREQLNIEREHGRAQADKFAELADQSQKLHAGYIIGAPQITSGGPNEGTEQRGFFTRVFGRKKTRST